jgi:hypothetical protein
MNVTKRIAAIGSIIALVVVSGCASLDASYDGNGNGGATQGQDILHLMHIDSQGGE